MADAVWPAGLDDLAPLLVSWTKTEPNLVARSQMDAGPDKVRRRLTAGVTLHIIEICVTRTQLTTIFRPFWTDTIEAGALPFQWRDWETQEDADFRFLEPPTERPLRPRGSGTNDHWLVSFRLEQLPVAPATVTPPAADNELPGAVLVEYEAAGIAWSDDVLTTQDTSYTPVPNDTDATPIFVDYVEDGAAANDSLIDVPMEDSAGVFTGSHNSLHIGPSDG